MDSLTANTGTTSVGTGENAESNEAAQGDARRNNIPNLSLPAAVPQVPSGNGSKDDPGDGEEGKEEEEEDDESLQDAEDIVEDS